MFISYRHDKIGKLIRNKERSSAKVLIEKLNMENNE